MNNFWDERYSEKEFVYGTEPNQFLAEQLVNHPPGKIIFPCEGEGRNAVFAAQKGWQAEAFDSSEAGFKKASSLAEHNKVAVSYQIADASAVEYPPASFDAAALIFAHFAPSVRRSIHQKIIRWLKPGGLLILEAFNPLQIKNTSGGPKEPAMLYTEEMLREDFSLLKTKMLTSLKITLHEGKYHQGAADVVRYIGLKEK
jgi:ubiquinone/menaquinone biosynthesis C-methylase UbiE